MWCPGHCFPTGQIILNEHELCFKLHSTNKFRIIKWIKYLKQFRNRPIKKKVVKRKHWKSEVEVD